MVLRRWEKRAHSRTRTRGRSRWEGYVPAMAQHGEGMGKDNSLRTSENYVGLNSCDRSQVDIEDGKDQIESAILQFRHVHVSSTQISRVVLH
jgi:hypothetical protein